MIIKTKKVYYCEFCKKKGLSAGHISKHEKHCTANPKRVCGVCGSIGLPENGIKLVKATQVMLVLRRKKEDIGVNFKDLEKFKLRIKKIAEDINCPACVLACLRQAGLRQDAGYDYIEEMKKYWDDKEKEESEAEWRQSISI